jgi:hypothetical protein
MCRTRNVSQVINMFSFLSFFNKNENLKKRKQRILGSLQKLKHFEINFIKIYIF